MKKILLALLMSLTCAVSFAQTTGTGNNGSTGTGAGSGSQSTSAAGANNQGNSQNITFTSPQNTTSSSSVTSSGVITENVNGTQTLKNTPNPGAPALTTSNDTCMGSTSGSVTIAGFGFGAGTTWTDTNCKRLKNSREFWNMGMRAAALALLCNDQENRDALEDTGYTCPEHKKRDQTVGDAKNTP